MEQEVDVISLILDWSL